MNTTNMKNVGENDQCEFFENSTTMTLTQSARMKCLDYRCLIARQKSGGHEDYVLVTGGEIVFDSKSVEGVYAHLDAAWLSQRPEEARR